ncbi:MAG: fumarate hydratase [Oscillospiraceae bacterium]|jgi:fumarate hydratase subunit alpha|nr:fumarate hydratase [Oscillospiraceae bacterium]
MRIIPAAQITDAVARLCVTANHTLPDSVFAALSTAAEHESDERARGILRTLTENAELARRERVPICQDTGIACVFIDLGRDAHIDGDLYDAINRGVATGYRDGYLRASVVRDPLRRDNTGDNTPANVYLTLVDGDRATITVAPKGFGSENMSRIKMLKPSDGAAGVVDFVAETVKLAGGRPCPPIILGIGIGGTFDTVALLAKRALLRDIGAPHPDPYYAELEREILSRVNALGIGAQGFGGDTTALGAAIETAPTHIAGLPAAVNVSCHVTRHATEVI